MIEVSSLAELKAHGVRRVALACGNFDGLHKGHRTIIDCLLAASKKNDATPVLMTFHPHPREVLFGHQIPTLSTMENKAEILEEMGVKAVVTLPFTKELASLTAWNFVQRYLYWPGMRVTDVCIGSQWKFGASQQGDVTYLRSLGLFKVHGVGELRQEHELVSSTRIREALASGDMRKAEELLCRPYKISGEVVHGLKLATEVLGFPTANIGFKEKVLPLSGVFAVKVRLPGEKQWRNGACNVGTAPTFIEKGSKMGIEVHILDFDGDLYGKELTVHFVERIRQEKKFDCPEALKEQISKDVSAARVILEA